jgi:23S rRNA pseudouridine1911/1915/1917 synthase
MKLPILYEDNHLLVVDKPAGWVVQGASPSDTSMITEASNYLREKYQKPGNIYVGVVSRLDRVVTGVLPLAKTSKAAARLSEQFRMRTVGKIYWAIVTGNPPALKEPLRHWLVRNERLAKTFCYEQKRDQASEGVLSFRIIQAWERFKLLEIQLETGRKHQIRAQLEAIGCPVVGDRKYGSPMTWHESIALHCRSVEIEHPTHKNRLKWESHIPSTWDKLGMPPILSTSKEISG